jgi:hypothetical protein
LLASRHVQLEPLELTMGDGAEMRYRARVSTGATIEELSALLLADEQSGLKSVSWEALRKPA